MKTHGLKTVVVAALILLSAATLRAQPTANPTSFNFSYQVNTTTLPAAGKLTATLSKTASTGYTLTASVSPPMSWLTVTPGSGASPLTLTVTVNPTGLSPGSYSGVITLGTNPGTSTTLVPVTLSISNPPSSITVTPAAAVTNYTPGVSGANPVLAYNYTTGQPGALPTTAELDVSSSGGIIPFTVTAASGSKTSSWLKINVTNQLPSLQTSGVALSGSYVPIYVSIDSNALTTLNVGPYAGTITFTNNSSGAVAATFSVSLNVSAGPPTITSIFPSHVSAAPSSGRVPPVVTIYGDNFFSNSSVQLTPDGAQPLPALAPTLLSRQVLQATLNPSYLTKPGSFTLTVANPSTLSDPTPQQFSVSFTVTDGTVPEINSVVNAASYLSSATWKGTIGLDPVPGQSLPGSSAVSPREIIAIFGQSIGPSSVVAAVASTAFPATFPLQVTPTVAAGVSPVKYEVLFKFGVYPTIISAPIIMVSSNQINAVVPVPPPAASVYTLAAPNAWVQVQETTGSGPSATVVTTSWFPVTFVPEVPGVFTFGGLGLGQAATLNYDATTGYSINSSKNPAPKGSTISLYVTGLGDLTAGSTITVTDSSTPPVQASQTFGLIINPTPAITASLTPTVVPIAVGQNVFSATSLQAVGGTPPYTWSVTSGMPTGMTLSSSGLLSGTPTVTGVFSLAVSVTDNAAIAPVSATYTVTVNAPTVTVTTSGLVPGVQSVAYPATTLTASGGKGPYTWSATALPAGMSLSAAGVLTGTPTTGGSYSPAFTATDSSSPGVASVPATITLNVLLSGMTITTPSLPNGVVNVPYVSTTFQQQGGTAPIAWSPGGLLPTGLTLSAAGVLSGTPTAAGAANITINVTDSGGLLATFTYAINIAAPVSISTAALPTGTQSVAYPAILMQGAGGTPPYKWTASGLPLGMTMTSSGVLAGIPSVPFYLPLPDGAVALGAVYVADNTYRVEINGQAAVTSYAGASQGSVAGLTQINAIVPPTAPTGAAIPMVVFIGKTNSARASQLSVTLAVQ
jgi:uncharacterized protein (TIGR03437 family)